ncbi:ABC transporter substrate-binding protein [Proteinivorax hydrogeniformans]|uniref:ABC transporter substrate-binding protein n=1 Tax=Proteinivorax hydrogeniformans TaxID=1826727 RepID=A0AAU8HR97_9FIRM
MLKKSLVLVLSLVLIVGFAVGCTPPGPDTGGRITRALIGDPDNFNPILYSESASGDIIPFLFDGMMRRNVDFELVPHIAKEWDVSEDDTEITFWLNEGVEFHDGVELTAHDVEFTIATMMNPDYPGIRGGNFQHIEDIEVIDDYQIKFTLIEPFGPIMNHLSWNIIPKHIFEEQVEEDISELDGHPANRGRNADVIGAGPYKWGEWVDGEYVRLTRNDNYWLDDEMPFIEELYFIDVQDTEAQMRALEQGEIDYAGVQPSDREHIVSEKGPEGDGTLKFEEVDQLGYTALWYNHREDAFGDDLNPFTDVKVRQAITHAINRQQVIDEILDGQGYLMHSHFPRSSWAYSEEDINKIEYNQERAGELLDEAGWLEVEGSDYRHLDGDINNQKFEFTLITHPENSIRMDMQVIAQEQLREVGIKVEPELVEWQTFLANHVDVGNFHAVILGWNLGADPDPYNIFHSDMIDVGFNDVGYANDRVDELIEEGRGLVDEDERRVPYAELQRVMSEDLPYTFLFASKQTIAIPADLEGYEVGDTALYYPEQWYMEEHSAE